jgi:AraC-like DNA-binding protein
MDRWTETGGARPTSRLWPTGTAAEHEIVAAVRPAEARIHITGALRDVAQVRFLPSLATLDHTHDSAAPLLGLLYLDGHDQPAAAQDWVATVYPFRARWTDVPVVAYAHYSADVMRQCLHAGLAGVTDLVVRGSQDLAEVITPILERRSAHPMIRAIISEVLQVRGPLNADTVRIFHYALEHVRERLTVNELAAGVGVSRRTVTNYLAHAGLESPERFLMWSRILVLAWLLRNETFSVNRAIRILGFDSPAFRHLVARYLEHSCEGLRGPDGIAHVVLAMSRDATVTRGAPAFASVTVLPAESLPVVSPSGIIGQQ